MATEYERLKARKDEILSKQEASAACDCSTTAPTYPIYRHTRHLPSCRFYAQEIQQVAPVSESARAWREWFDRVGSRANTDVVNATANLVIAEREIGVQRVRDFYEPRMNALQQLQKELPEPHRTAVCNILANGTPTPQG